MLRDVDWWRWRWRRWIRGGCVKSRRWRWRWRWLQGYAYMGAKGFFGQYFFGDSWCWWCECYQWWRQYLYIRISDDDSWRWRCGWCGYLHDSRCCWRGGYCIGQWGFCNNLQWISWWCGRRRIF
mgnify:FL=1